MVPCRDGGRTYTASAVMRSNLKYCNGPCVWGGLWRCVAGSGRAAASCVHGNSKVRAEKLENVIGSAVVIYSCHVRAKAEHSRFGFGPPRDHLAPAKTLPAALFPAQQSSTDHCRCRAATRVLCLPVLVRYLLGASTLPHRGSRVSCQRTLRSLKQTRSSALVYFVPSTAHSSHLYRGLIAYNVILL